MKTQLDVRARANGLGDAVRRSKAWILIPVAMWLAWWAGSAVAAGGPGRTLALSLAALAVGIPTVRVTLARRLRPGFLTVEAPVLLLLISTLVFRIRSAYELAYNPLDPSAQFRVICVALALMLGGLALISRPYAHPSNGRLTSRPVRLYLLYVFVVFLGAPMSLSLSLTAYRGIELITGVIVFVGARRIVGDEAAERIGALLYWFTVGLVMSIWISVILAPDRALFHPIDTPIPWTIEGVYPLIAANGVGSLGVLLFFWSIARSRAQAAGPNIHRRVSYVLAALGLVTLFIAQYRTGYAALVVGLLVYLFIGKKHVLATLLLLTVIGVVAANPSAIWADVEPLALRGQSVERASSLSGRTEFWRAAIPVWEESPLIGRGLLTGTRFEVLAPLGMTETSAIHSTWVEALVGTGLIGLSLLSLSLLVTLRRALVRALRMGDLVPVLLLTVLTVRTITGNTFETFSQEAMIFLWIAMTLADPVRERKPAIPSTVHA
jgi:O-antigen ligase